MSEVNGVTIVLELHRPGESVVVACWPLLWDLILIVADVLASSLPAGGAAEAAASCRSTPVAAGAQAPEAPATMVRKETP